MKTARILIALALIVVVVAAAQGGVGAWSARLKVDSKAVAPAPAEAGARPQGTVGGVSEVPIGPTDCTLIATYCVTSPQTGLTAQAITELPNGLKPPQGEKVVPTRMIQIIGKVSKTTAEIVFALTPPLTTEVVAYWDGTQWVHLTIKDGKYTVEAGAPLPLVISVFVAE